MAEQTANDNASSGSPQQSAPANALSSAAASNSLDTDNAPGTAPSGGEPAPSSDKKDEKPAKPPGKLKLLFKRVNIYLLLFAMLVVIGGIISIVSYLNSKKAPVIPSLASQQLTSATLKQLANSDATVGASGQTLTVQGNAIFDGQELVRSDLDVAGNLQIGSVLNVPSLTVSNTANLPNTQINTLQVASNTTLQGAVTAQSTLNVGGAATFSGPVTAGQITVTKLILSGNAQLSVPNHIAFPGATPARTITPSTLGIGGSASLSGSDATGTVDIHSGSSTQPGCFITITFNQPYASLPHVLVTPVGSGAGQTQYYVNLSTTNFSICTANSAPTNVQFSYDYFITD